MTAGLTQLQAHRVLKNVTLVRGYFVHYHHGQKPHPERLRRLNAAGIYIPGDYSD